MTRAIVAVVAALGLLLSACGSDDAETTGTTEATSVQPDETPTTASVAPAETQAPATEPPSEAESTTTVAGDDRGEEQVVAATCEAFVGGARSSEDLLVLMSDDAVVHDHTLGTTHEGQEAIAVWVDEDPQLATFDLTTCGTTAVAGDGYAAGSYAFSSTTIDGGSEGVAVVKVTDGEVSEFHVHYTPVTEVDVHYTPVEPSPEAELATEDRHLVDDFCEAWGTGDAAQVAALASPDFVLTAPLGEFMGAEGIGQAMTVLDALYDGIECDDDIVSNGGWVAAPSRFVNSETGEVWGGIAVLLVEDGVISRQLVHFQEFDSAGEPVAA